MSEPTSAFLLILLATGQLPPAYSFSVVGSPPRPPRGQTMATIPQELNQFLTQEELDLICTEHDLDSNGLNCDGRQRQMQRRGAIYSSRPVDLQEANLACAWLWTRGKTKHVNKRSGTSYGHKHRAERAAGSYISNGALIAAAIHCGFQY